MKIDVIGFAVQRPSVVEGHNEFIMTFSGYVNHGGSDCSDGCVFNLFCGFSVLDFSK